jgi:hypothetical protein
MSEFWFDGSTWHPLRLSCDITAGQGFHVQIADTVSITELLAIDNTLQLGGVNDTIAVTDSVSAVLI